MKVQELQNVKQDTQKQSYEPPMANFYRVQLEESVGSCNYTSVDLCKYTN
jgi:hypothetical protein